MSDTGTGTGTGTAKPAKRRGLYLCKKCKAHGILDQPVRNHKRAWACPFKDCQCARCALVEHGRRVVAQQIQNYRMQMRHRQRRQLTDTAASESGMSATPRCLMLTLTLTTCLTPLLLPAARPTQKINLPKWWTTTRLLADAAEITAKSASIAKPKPKFGKIS